MAILRNTTITGTGSLTLPANTTLNRPTITTAVQTFNSTPGGGTWTVPAGVYSVEVLVVGGGGGGGSFNGGGGGAGGVVYRTNYNVTPGAAVTVTVGAGGIGDGRPGNGATGASGATGANGSNSVFDTLTALGGGAGATYAARTTAVSGGSGGGSWGGDRTLGALGTVGQGHAGGGGFGNGNSYTESAGGGGGAGQPGTRGAGTTQPGSGGNGLPFAITGTLTYYGGGGGAGQNRLGGYRGYGGLGGGGTGGTTSSLAGGAGTANTGGGGGGSAYNGTPGASADGGAGGSGVVIVRYSTLADGSDPRGLVRYNSDFNDIEVYEGVVEGWVAQSPNRNYASHNMLPYSENFSTFTGNYFGNWINSNVTAGQTDPLGGSTASLLTGYYARISTTIPVIAGQTYTFSCWLKNNALVNPVVLHIVRGLNGAQQGDTGLSISAASIANWTRFSVSYTVPTSGINQVQCGIGFGGSMSASATGYSVFVWGAQLEKGRTAGPYLLTNGARHEEPAHIDGYRIHAFKNTGNTQFIPAVSGTVEVLVVGGGGGGGSGFNKSAAGGGGGAGGLIYNKSYPVIAGRTYNVVVGAGGAQSTVGGSDVGGFGGQGGNSTFGNLVAVGGGGGTNYPDVRGMAGGSGGGAGGAGRTRASGGYNPGGAAVNGQGYPGGRNAGAGQSTTTTSCGGGGGAGGPGGDGTLTKAAGRGGAGLEIDISGTRSWYAAGGGGGTSQSPWGAVGGSGIGGAGGTSDGANGSAGVANTGSGGGGGSSDNTSSAGGAGGSGIVIVRYRYE